MTTDQAAAALGISERTARRYWVFARAWLHDELQLAGLNYRLQRATDLTGPWTTSAPQTAPASGLVEFSDLLPPPGQAFYRTASP